jgi:hypothetical protein
MSNKVYIALDLFFHKWNSNERGLWLAIQPYIEGSPEEVVKWIKTDVHDASITQFELLNPVQSSLLDKDKLVPLPLPSKINVQLKLSDKQGHEILNLELNRKEHCTLINPDKLKTLNYFSGDQSPETNSPYAKIFAQTLKDSISEGENKLEPIDLVDTLKQKLELGQRIHYDDTCFLHLGDAFDACRKEDANGIKATNIHYLLGQIFHLGSDISTLKRVHNIALILNGTELNNTDIGATAHIFASIKPLFAPDNFNQTLTWSKDFSYRINALPQGEVFKASKIEATQTFLWRMGQKDQTKAGTSNAIRWNKLERIDIREKADIPRADSLLIDPDPSIQTLRFKPMVTFDVSISKYRNSPQSSSSEKIKSMVAAIRPEPSQVNRFNQLVSEYPELLSSAKLFVSDLEVKLSDGTDNKKAINYELTPELIKSFKFPWSQPSDVLAFFNSSQEEATKSIPSDVAFNLEHYIFQSALLVIELPVDEQLDFTLNRLGVDTAATDLIDRNSVFGPRWEYWHEQDGGLNLPNFDALMFSSLNDKDVDLDQLIVIAFQEDRSEYELAQSARRLEGAVRVEFKNVRETDSTDLNSYDFEQTIIEDKTNHNQINVTEKRVNYHGAGKTLQRTDHNDHRNKGSAIGAFKTKEIKTDNPLVHHVHYGFRMVFTDKTSMPLDLNESEIAEQLSDQMGNESPSVRDFYVGVYENVGDGRDLTLDLEHTYGSCILETSEDNVPNPIDEPILLGTDVAHTIDSDSVKRLWEVSLGVNSQGKEVATLHFDTELLLGSWAEQSDARKLAHIQSWQSVAEMHYGQSVQLIAECYSFNVQKLELNNDINSLGSGLEVTYIELPAATILIQQLMEQVFADASTADNSIQIETGLHLAQDYNAVRFRLDVNRSTHMVPDPSSPRWEVHKRLAKIPAETDGGIESLFTMNGPLTRKLESKEIQQQIDTYLASIQKKGGYLHPQQNDVQNDRQTQFFAVLGNGRSLSHVSPSNNAWLIPDTIKQEQGTINATYCPVGIAPIFNHPHLQNKTSPLMRRYFEAVQTLIDFESIHWFKKSAVELKELVEELLAYLTSDAFNNLLISAVSKFEAVPNSNASADELIDSIRQLSKNSKTNGHPLNKAMYAKVTQLLTLQPALFSTLKSLALVQISSSTLPNIRNDFYDVFIGKKIRESEPSVDKTLPPSKMILKDDSKIIYLEQLDDSLYDNGFSFTQFNGQTAERIFEQKSTGTMDERFQIKLENGEIDIPEKSSKAIAKASIKLASRRPVQDPSVATFKQTSIASVPGSQYLSLPALLGGQIQPSLGESNNNDVLFQDVIGELIDNKHDQIVVSSIFHIKGDEEASDSNLTKLTDKFDNDAFFVLVSEESQVPKNQTHSALTADFVALIDRLESKTPLSLQDGLMDNVFGSGNITTVSQIIGKQSPDRFLPNEAIRQKAFRVVRGINSTKLGLEDRSSDLAQDAQYPCKTWLFKNDQNDCFLWVETELPIWKDQYISLVQVRNQAGFGDEQQRVFAPVFTSISNPIGNSLERVAKFVTLRGETERVEVNNELMTVMSFTQRILNGRIDGLDSSFAGARTILNITIKEDSSSVYPSNVGQQEVFKGTFAIYTFSFYPSDNYWEGLEKHQWFPKVSTLGRWRVDVEWRSSSTNDEILRIEDIPIRLV